MNINEFCRKQHIPFIIVKHYFCIMSQSFQRGFVYILFNAKGITLSKHHTLTNKQKKEEELIKKGDFIWCKAPSSAWYIGSSLPNQWSLNSLSQSSELNSKLHLFLKNLYDSGSINNPLWSFMFYSLSFKLYGVNQTANHWVSLAILPYAYTILLHSC